MRRIRFTPTPQPPTTEMSVPTQTPIPPPFSSTPRSCEFGLLVIRTQIRPKSAPRPPTRDRGGREYISPNSDTSAPGPILTSHITPRRFSFGGVGVVGGEGLSRRGGGVDQSHEFNFCLYKTIWEGGGWSIPLVEGPRGSLIWWGCPSYGARFYEADREGRGKGRFSSLPCPRGATAILFWYNFQSGTKCLPVSSEVVFALPVPRPPHPP